MLVLIMVVLLSVFMASAAVLNASASSIVKRSAADAEYRSAKVVNALGKALNYLSYDSAGTSRRFGMAGDACNVPAGGGGLIGTYDGVSVYCSPHPGSGLNNAVASLILTGTSGTTGKGAGLAAAIGGTVPNGNCVPNVGTVRRLKFSAGIVNVSGQWSGASCATMEFGAKGKITQPETATCPDNGTGSGSWWFTDDTTSKATKAKCINDNRGVTAESLSPTSSDSAIKTFITSINETITVPAGTPSITRANSCAVLVGSGVITSTSTFNTAKTLLGDCSGTKRIFFASSDSGTIGRIKLNSVLLAADSQVTTLIFGQPNSDYTDCDTSLPGTQLQLEGSGRIDVAGQTVIMCDPKGGQPSIVAPMPGDSSAPFTASNYADWAILSDSLGGTLTVRGFIFAPGAAANVRISGGNAEFASGAMLRAMDFFSSAKPAGFPDVPPPPELAGDRLVQLRFVDSDMRDLGMVQVIIRDYYGRRRAIGYGFKMWRTSW